MQLAVTNVECFSRHQTATEEMSYWGKVQNLLFFGEGVEMQVTLLESYSLPPSARTLIPTLMARQDILKVAARTGGCRDIAIGLCFLQTELKISTVFFLCF
jgi:hypothetical protein